MQNYFFPEYNKNIEAESIEEAEKILFNEIKNVWENKEVSTDMKPKKVSWNK